jgi:hypothetical protein
MRCSARDDRLEDCDNRAATGTLTVGADENDELLVRKVVVGKGSKGDFTTALEGGRGR